MAASLLSPPPAVLHARHSDDRVLLTIASAPDTLAWPELEHHMTMLPCIPGAWYASPASCRNMERRTSAAWIWGRPAYPILNSKEAFKSPPTTTWSA